MPVREYEEGCGVVDSSVAAANAVDYGKLKGKSVIVTGGASGLGEGMVRSFVKSGAFVTIADINEELGDNVSKELGERGSQYVKCDVTSWDDQVAMFKAAIANSPQKSCDVVVANAGIGFPDTVFEFEETDEPTKPDLKVLEVNQTGVIYTAKLAFYHFNKQPETGDRDRCLILTASLAAFVDTPGLVQYNMSKFSVRGLMRSLRRVSCMKGIRMNTIAPWFIETPIFGDSFKQHLDACGVDVALREDAAAATLRIAADNSVHGRSLGIVPRKMSPTGYTDLKQDDPEVGSLMSYFQSGILSALGTAG